MKIKKFLAVYEKNQFINIDYIVSMGKNIYGEFWVTMCDGKSYQINDYCEAEKLFNYIKNKTIELKGEK